jgi:hypothetical protein
MTTTNPITLLQNMFYFSQRAYYAPMRCSCYMIVLVDEAFEPQEKEALVKDTEGPSLSGIKEHTHHTHTHLRTRTHCVSQGSHEPMKTGKHLEIEKKYSRSGKLLEFHADVKFPGKRRGKKSVRFRIYSVLRGRVI